MVLLVIDGHISVLLAMIFTLLDDPAKGDGLIGIYSLIFKWGVMHYTSS